MFNKVVLILYFFSYIIKYRKQIRFILRNIIRYIVRKWANLILLSRHHYYFNSHSLGSLESCTVTVTPNLSTHGMLSVMECATRH